MKSHALVKTQYGQTYPKRLCRHFSHKIPVSIDGDRGTNELPFAECTNLTSDNTMQISVEAESLDETECVGDVIADHLIRMANRDEPTVNWEDFLD